MCVLSCDAGCNGQSVRLLRCLGVELLGLVRGPAALNVLGDRRLYGRSGKVL